MSCKAFARLFCLISSPGLGGASLAHLALLASSHRDERLTRTALESPGDDAKPSFAYSIALESRLGNSSLPNLPWKAWTPFTSPGATTEKGPNEGTPR